MKNIASSLLLLFSLQLLAQDTAKMQIEYGVEDPLVQGLFGFENINIDQVRLSGVSIENKHYD